MGKWLQQFRDVFLSCIAHKLPEDLRAVQAEFFLVSIFDESRKKFFVD
jgi:hypothetical protein